MERVQYDQMGSEDEDQRTLSPMQKQREQKKRSKSCRRRNQIDRSFEELDEINERH